MNTRRLTPPDSDWYKKKSMDSSNPSECPYASAHKCYRYYASISVLGEVGITTSPHQDTKDKLDILWENSNLIPIIAENDTSIFGHNNRSSSFINFCPEVSFKTFGYYASYLSRYADEVDKDIGQKIAERESIKNDWRFDWSHLSECHFLDCSVYNQVNHHNTENQGELSKLIHPNIKILLARMEQCLEKRDPPGVLHASASALETLAKDIIGSEKLENQTLGGFIEKYKKESKVPVEIKEVIGKIYNLRNTSPLSGHGSTTPSNINMTDAILIAATTKLIVEIEYRLKNLDFDNN